MSLSTSSLGYGCHLHDSTVVIVVVVNTRPRAIPLAMITMRKSIHGFSSVFYIGMGLRLAARSFAANRPYTENPETLYDIMDNEQGAALVLSGVWHTVF